MDEGCNDKVSRGKRTGQARGRKELTCATGPQPSSSLLAWTISGHLHSTSFLSPPLHPLSSPVAFSQRSSLFTPTLLSTSHRLLPCLCPHPHARLPDSASVPATSICSFHQASPRKVSTNQAPVLPRSVRMYFPLTTRSSFPRSQPPSSSLLIPKVATGAYSHSITSISFGLALALQSRKEITTKLFS